MAAPPPLGLFGWQLASLRPVLIQRQGAITFPNLAGVDCVMHEPVATLGTVDDVRCGFLISFLHYPPPFKLPDPLPSYHWA